MLLERSLRVLQEDRNALLSGLQNRYKQEHQTLPLPNHLTSTLFEAHLRDEECNELLAQASCGWIDSLILEGPAVLKKSIISQWKCSKLCLRNVKLTGDRIFDYLAPEAVVIEGSFQVEDVSVLTAPLRSCASLTISAPIDDELFVQLGKQILGQNVHLRKLDLRGSGVDLMAPQTRRNSPLNLAAEMRRWSRRLKEICFESKHPLTRVIRVLVRQCPALKALSVAGCSEQNPLESFEESFKLPSTESITVETHAKLKYLFLRGNESVTDQQLVDCLKGLPNLEVLDVVDCPVNFDAFLEFLPGSLEIFRTDEQINEKALPFKVEWERSTNTNISIMRLMLGAQSQLSQQSDGFKF